MNVNGGATALATFLAMLLAACGSGKADNQAAEPATPKPASALVDPAPLAFATCRSCHSTQPGQNGIGPTLAGVFGARAGALPGYAFSPALKNAGITWNRASLDTWLQGPIRMVPGTKMALPVSDPAKRRAIIDYLETLEGPGAVTPDEVHALAEIQQCLARCTQAGDARRGDAYASCFAMDGVLELRDETIAGREAIRAWMRAPSVIPAPSGGAPGFISHHLTTSSVEFTGNDTATARTYWLVTSAAGLDHNGFYTDHLRRDHGAWLIALRRPRTLWVSPASVLHKT